MSDRSESRHVAEDYRAHVRASGNRAEWAAIEGMPDEFVAAIALGDLDAAARAAHTFGPGDGGSGA